MVRKNKKNSSRIVAYKINSTLKKIVKAGRKAGKVPVTFSRSRILLLVLVVSMLSVAVASGALTHLWQRSISASFTVSSTNPGTDTGTPGEPGVIEAFLSPGWWEFQGKSESLELNEGSTLLSFTKCTVTTPISLDIIYTADGGAELVCWGQYVMLYLADNQPHTIDVGDSFSIPLDGSPVALTGNLIWANCQTPGVTGHALRISFFIVSDGLTPGVYTSDLTIGLST